MTEISSFSSASESNSQASFADTAKVNSENEGSTAPGPCVNLARQSAGPGSTVTIKADPGIDTHETERFLTEVFGQSAGIVELAAFLQGSRKPVCAFRRIGEEITRPDGSVLRVDPAIMASAVARGDDGITEGGEKKAVDAWYVRMTTLAVEPEGSQRGGASNVREFFGFWLDGDYAVDGHHKTDRADGSVILPPDADAVRALWTAAGYPPPTVEWMTGGGVNGLWLLHEPVTVEDGPEGRDTYQLLRAASKRWHERVRMVAFQEGYHHDTTHNLDRLVRLPGSVNRKVMHDPKAVTAAYHGPRYHLTDLLDLIPQPQRTADGALIDPVSGQLLQAAPDQAHMPGMKGRPGGGAPIEGLTPWDDFDARADWWGDVLGVLGFQHHSWAGQTENLTRPGKDMRDGLSATLNHDGLDKLYLFSDTVERMFPSVKPYTAQYLTKSQALCHMAHGGDWAALARDLRGRGYGDGTPFQGRPVPVGPAADGADLFAGQTADDGTVQAEPPDVPEPDEGATGEKKYPGLLPEKFWAKRTVLQHIRQAAHARCASGDATLYSVLTRLSGMTDHRIVADVGQGHVPLNLIAGVVGDSAANKTSSNRAGREMLMTPERDFRGDLPIGSGEGICEQFMGEKETGEFYEKGQKKGEPKTERGQVRHNIHFYVDEGETLIRLGRRENSTLWPTLRSAWAGDTLGQTNATADRNRYIEAGSYAFGMFVGFQPSNAEPVLRDAETGTAQRFVWCQAVDPAIPMKRTEHPGPLLVYPQLREVVPADGERLVIGFPEELKDRLWEERVLRGRGELDVDPLDKHSNMVKIKLAALMAMLDGGRWDVTMEDWELAEMMWAASCELRTHLLAIADARIARDAEAKRTATVETATAIHEAKADADAARLRIGRWVHKKVAEGVPRNELIRKVNSRDRKQLVTGLRYALAQGWITEDDDGNLSVGDSQPA